MSVACRCCVLSTFSCPVTCPYCLPRPSMQTGASSTGAIFLHLQGCLRHSQQHCSAPRGPNNIRECANNVPIYHNKVALLLRQVALTACQYAKKVVLLIRQGALTIRGFTAKSCVIVEIDFSKNLDKLWSICRPSKIINYYRSPYTHTMSKITHLQRDMRDHGRTLMSSLRRSRL